MHVDNGSALTLDQAAQIGWDDEDEPDTKAKLAPQSVAAVVDGEQVSLAHLVQGYATWKRMRHLIDRLNEEYGAVQDAANGVVTSAWELSRFISSQMPPAPEISLLHFNPDEYLIQKAQHEQALASVQHVLAQAHQARASASALQQRYHEKYLETENQRLTAYFPETAIPEQRRQFFDRMLDVAMACGYSRADFEEATDHRIFRLGALALKGMEAIADTPRPKEKRRQRRKRYSDAMERLIKTGSFDDAVNVDFD